MTTTVRRYLLLAMLLEAGRTDCLAASWTQLTNAAPGGVNTPILLTDGTVMALNGSNTLQWMKLTPDAHGSYINGTWATLAPMSTQRLYFASNVLPNGRVWVMGGEYSGVGLPTNETGTAEIYDPIANAWSPAAPFPNQTGCLVGEFGGTVAKGTPVVTNIASTANWQVGWTIAGGGIPTGSTIASIDSATQLQISNNATSSGDVTLTLTVPTTGNTTAGSNVITGLPSTTGFQKSFGLSGPGIPSGANITSVDSPTQVHISQNATATASGANLTFAVTFIPSTCFGDSPSILLPGGNILAGNFTSLNTYLYSPATDTWNLAATKKYSASSEQGWAMLDDGTIVTYDIGKSISTKLGYAERYDPVANKWSSISPSDNTAQGTLPLLSTPATGDELGPMLRLYDGRLFVAGANGNTALYTPSTNTWTAGPQIVGSVGGAPLPFGSDDAPGAILPNGHVIFVADAALGLATTGTTTSGSPVVTGIPSTVQLLAGWAVSGAGIPSGTTIKSVDSVSQITLSANASASGAAVALEFGGVYSKPAQLFDFDPSTNLIAAATPAIPDTHLANDPGFVPRMLMLPTGQLLLTVGSNQPWVYTPDGAASPLLLPRISTLASNGGGLFTLTGAQLSGQSAGSMYGDDVQNNENYPIVSLTSPSGNVFYARTTNWSYIGVGPGPAIQTVNFTLPAQMTGGSYSLVVSAAGIASNPVPVTLSSDLSKLTLTPAVGSVQDAESARKSIVPGQWMAIYGSGLANSTRVWNIADFKGGTAPGSALPISLDGVQVTIGGQAAAVYFISPTQIDVQAPANLPAGSANAIVDNNGIFSAAVSVTVATTSPAFFSYGAGGNLYPAATSLSGVLIGDPAISGSSVKKALPGQTIILYANGLASSQAGVIVTPATFSTPISISAGAYPLTVLGGALVSAGEFQINVQLPADIPPGSYPLSLSLPNGSTSTAGVTVLLPVGP